MTVRIAFLSLFFLFMNSMVLGQQYALQTDPDGAADMLTGSFSFEVLDHNFTWLTEGYEAYHPDTAVIASLKSELKNCSVVIVLGTWCDDSRLLLPKFYKVLVAAEFPMGNVTLIGVDRKKETITGIEKTYRATRVPTIILFRGVKELGRIEESVQNSAELDLLELASGGN